MRGLVAMRSDPKIAETFVVGFVAGLALVGVTVLTVGAVRRMRRGRSSPNTEMADFIDGVHPPNGAECGARPAQEVNMFEHRLVSEAIDASPMSQRW